VTDTTDWPTLCSRFEVLGALPITADCVQGDLSPCGSDLAVRFTMIVPDVCTGSPLGISITRPVPDGADPLEWLREQARWLYVHEIDEQLCLAGVPVFRHEAGEVHAL
jgi:hypothetical protein